MEWLAGLPTLAEVLTQMGIGALVLLFATGVIITRWQHNSRVADLKAHHERELAAKDERIAGLEESRLYWRTAAEKHDERADKALDALGEFTEVGELVTDVMRGLKRAAEVER